MIKFGVAGYPPAFNLSSFKKNRLKIFEWINSIGLDAFEAQMTYGPRTTKENCLEIKKASSEFNIKVSIHGSYFIVFTSNDKKKIEQSLDTLKRTYELADIIGSDIIVLHPGPLYGDVPSEIMKRIEENLGNFFNNLGQNKIGLFLETAGKRGQLGSIGEIFNLTTTIEGCYPCIDFGHVHARTGGTLNNPESIDSLFQNLDDLGAFTTTKRIHFHYTPIHYGPKGEISHKAIEDEYETSQLDLDLFKKPADKLYHPRYNKIIENLILRNADFTVISETHDSQDRGALAMKKLYHDIISKNQDLIISNPSKPFSMVH